MHNLLPGQLAGRSQFGWRRSHLNLRTLVAISITTHYGGSLQITPGYCSQQQDQGGIGMAHAGHHSMRVPASSAVNKEKTHTIRTVK